MKFCGEFKTNPWNSEIEGLSILEKWSPLRVCPLNLSEVEIVALFLNTSQSFAKAAICMQNSFYSNYFLYHIRKVATHKLGLLYTSTYLVNAFTHNGTISSFFVFHEVETW